VTASPLLSRHWCCLPTASSSTTSNSSKFTSIVSATEQRNYVGGQCRCKVGPGQRWGVWGIGRVVWCFGCSLFKYTHLVAWAGCSSVGLERPSEHTFAICSFTLQPNRSSLTFSFTCTFTRTFTCTFTCTFYIHPCPRWAAGLPLLCVVPEGNHDPQPGHVLPSAWPVLPVQLLPCGLPSGEGLGCCRCS
jgi:hypothetical protein